jgi:hypothetical protein
MEDLMIKWVAAKVVLHMLMQEQRNKRANVL